MTVVRCPLELSKHEMKVLRSYLPNDCCGDLKQKLDEAMAKFPPGEPSPDSVIQYQLDSGQVVHGHHDPGTGDAKVPSRWPWKFDDYYGHGIVGARRSWDEILEEARPGTLRVFTAGKVVN